MPHVTLSVNIIYDTYMIHVCSRAVSMHMYSPAWSIVPPCGWGRLSLIRVCLIVSLCEGELCCLGHRRKFNALCLVFEIYHRVDHPIKEYLKHFRAPRNTRASAALAEFGLRSTPAAELVNSVGHFFRLLSVYGTCIRRACLLVAHWALLTILWTFACWGLTLIFYLYFNFFMLLYSFLGIMVLEPFWFIGAFLFLVLWTRYFK